MLAKTPPMGFNTWNTFGVNINDKLIREIADAMADNGLLEAGYEYLVLDDTWSEKERDPETDRIIPNREKFPNGMKAVSDYVHSKGLKFGLYSCAGVRTCTDHPGSFNHEFKDAETFAEYGCDFLKYDFCYKPVIADGPQLYYRMSMALKACGREILFSACNWGADEVNKWIRSSGAHMYRTTGDINDSFESFKSIALSQLPALCHSAPGCFNDMDMLTVGMYGRGNVGSVGCNDTEYRTQFALWCFFSAPLMIGCDVRSMTPETKALLTNKALISINQDEEARPAFAVGLYPWNEDTKVFMKHLSGGEYALGFFNLSERDCSIPAAFWHFGLDAGYGMVLTDCFTGEESGVIREYYSPFVAKHDCAVYRAKVVKL